ncbi:transposase [Streptomyces sp. M10(2022)]
MSRAIFPVWRYHPFLTDQPALTLQAEREHRHHAVIEQVIADSKAGALAHLPSGHFHANAAWLTLWAMTYNLLRAAGSLTSAFHAKATTATLRTHLIHVPARIARSARRITLHLPHNWPWQHAWTHLFDTVPPGHSGDRGRGTNVRRQVTGSLRITPAPAGHPCVVRGNSVIDLPPDAFLAGRRNRASPTSVVDRTLAQPAT